MDERKVLEFIESCIRLGQGVEMLNSRKPTIDVVTIDLQHRGNAGFWDDVMILEISGGRRFKLTIDEMFD